MLSECRFALSEVLQLLQKASSLEVSKFFGIDVWSINECFLIALYTGIKHLSSATTFALFLPWGFIASAQVS